MKLLSVAAEILPVIGTIGLLGLWLFQQKQIEKYAGELRKINAARSTFQTYQSNNAIFNAIISLVSKNNGVSNEIRRYQISNYEFGLRDMEKLLTKSEKKDSPVEHANIFESDENIQTAINTTQKRLELLQEKLDEKEQKIKLASDRSGKIYFWAYICFSIISITGAILKISTKK